MPHPKINPAVLMAPAESGYVAYDPALDRLHQLNPIAALLAELCDGSRSVMELRALAGPLMPEGKTEEIDRWITDAMAAGLLIWTGEQTIRAPKPSATERSTLALRSALFSARHLKQPGKARALYRKLKKTVASKPNDWSAWYDLGKLAQCLGQREEARAAYRTYFDAHPEDGETELLLMAFEDEAPPRASDSAIRHLFKGFAASYDSRMRRDLNYVGPERTQEVIAAVIGERAGLTVLDLGCGSGLAGAGLRQRAAELVGVDLSPEMIALARARALYDRLEVAEITAWLDQGETCFDLIICCDCLIYFGDLHAILRSTVRRLGTDGIVALSMERSPRYPFHVTDAGRYAHHPDHLSEAAAKAGLRIARQDEGFLRTEYGEDVMGLYAVLEKTEKI